MRSILCLFPQVPAPLLRVQGWGELPIFNMNICKPQDIRGPRGKVNRADRSVRDTPVGHVGSSESPLLYGDGFYRPETVHNVDRFG